MHIFFIKGQLISMTLWRLKFRFLGRNSSKLFGDFLENFRHQKLILKLTYLKLTSKTLRLI